MIDNKDKYLLEMTKTTFSDSFRICPLCSFKGKFEPFGIDGKRPDSICPLCGSLERTRLHYTTLISAGLGKTHRKILHINTEDSLRKALQNTHGVLYMVRGLSDLDTVSVPKGGFDIIIANNVTDRANDDFQFLSKANTMLSDNGIALLTVEMIDGKSDMKSIPRKYNFEYLKLVSDAGFTAEDLHGTDILGSAMTYIFGIGPGDHVIVARKI